MAATRRAPARPKMMAKSRKALPRRSSSAPRRNRGAPRPLGLSMGQVGTGMQAASAAAGRLAAITPVPQARLALAGGSLALNAAGNVIKSMDKPTRSFSANPSRASKIKVDRKIARKRRKANTTRGR